MQPAVGFRANYIDAVFSLKSEALLCAFVVVILRRVSMLFGLPFPTYLGWIIWPVGMIVMLAIINREYRKYLNQEAAKKLDLLRADMSREG